MSSVPRLSAVPAQPLRRPSEDPRVRAAAAVLSGRPVDEVAVESGADVRQVLRWAHALQVGGAAAVGGVGVDRPSDGPSASTVAVEDFLSVVAHEVRTPLTAARSGLRVLAAPDVDPEVRARVAQTVQQRLTDLQRLTDDLITAVEVASGRTRPQPERVDLTAVVATACAEAGLLPPADGTALHVAADPAHTATVAATLLAHAARYAAPEATTVRVQRVADGGLLTVRMDGARLDPDSGACAFEPFGAAARGDGNGLALYVVRALVVAAGGQVGIAGSDAGTSGQPAAGAATVLWAHLPLHSPRPVPLARVPVRPSREPRSTP